MSTPIMRVIEIAKDIGAADARRALSIFTIRLRELAAHEEFEDAKRDAERAYRSSEEFGVTP